MRFTISPLIFILGCAGAMSHDLSCLRDLISSLSPTCRDSISIIACLHTTDNAPVSAIESCFRRNACPDEDVHSATNRFINSCRTDTNTESKEHTESSTASVTSNQNTHPTSTVSHAQVTLQTESTTRSLSSHETNIMATRATSSFKCSVTSLIPTSVCSFSGQHVLGCTSTAIATASCAPENICFKSTGGADVCMRRDERLGTAGLIITIVFLSAISISMTGVIIIYLRTKSSKYEDNQAVTIESSPDEISKEENGPPSLDNGYGQKERVSNEPRAIKGYPARPRQSYYSENPPTRVLLGPRTPQIRSGHEEWNSGAARR
ncbi:hypothetical protein BGHDH14_bghG001319000001001 [Blumeria hordei DH14]|uniref:Extracellular membrane protein CFEM domain-containing protein n=1 Tax=Blumeria graminis f. sp. hordei (strain DH14) TaxID=546991 RepID=N1JBY9_BLUG1|nr:hypothetical protein BGHDH14_bghG001319000001001 [Blumeria hordei DH14]